MKATLHDETPRVYDSEPRSSLAYLTLELVRLASKLGYVITVEQVPLQPLAMGHYKTQVNVRPARVRS